MNELTVDARLPSINGFPNLDRAADRVERRHDRVFLVDLVGRFPEPEVEVLPEEISGFEAWKFSFEHPAQPLTLDSLAGHARRISESPALSEDGRSERLAVIRELVAARFPPGFLIPGILVRYPEFV